MTSEAEKISGVMPAADTSSGRRKLPPDPEQMNDRRSCSAHKAITAYRKATNCDVDTALYDLLSDLMHLCDRRPEFGSFIEECGRALRCYDEEIMAKGTMYAEANKD